MALDQQRNWDISMAENLEKVVRNSREKEAKDQTKNTQTHPPLPPKVWTTPPIHLPDEILVQILEFVDKSYNSQVTLASCCLLSHQWFTAAVPYLYRHPNLYGNKFEPFIKAICPSKNLHVRKSPLAGLVKVLDMSGLVHQGSKSTTARLLSRTKYSLEEFVAPQASFGFNCLAGLAKSSNLRSLNLSLVSESPPLLDLFKAISHLEKLTTLRLPRSAGFSVKVDSSQVVWPPNLENLCLSGGIDNHFLHGVVELPVSLRGLTVEHCPMLHGSDIVHFLNNAVRPLPSVENLKLASLPRLTESSLDCILSVLPGLTKLSISVDYITPTFFDLANNLEYKEYYAANLYSRHDWTRHEWREGRFSQLKTLELTNSGNPGVEDKISPIDILIAIEEGQLPDLRQVRVAKSLLWHSGGTAADVQALIDALKDSAIEKQDIDLENVGVWTFD